MPIVPVSTLPPFASLTDLETLLQRTFTAGETAAADLVLNMASTAVRSYTGQTINVIEDDVVTLDPAASGLLFLPELPVIGVASIVASGISLTPGNDSNRSGYFWYGDTGMVRLGATACAGWWQSACAGWWQSVVVTYSHGYDEIPDAAHDVTLEAAAALLGFYAGSQADGTHSETIGNYSVTYEATYRKVEEIGATRLDRLRVLVVA